jgi:hypothetical protein
MKKPKEAKRPIELFADSVDKITVFNQTKKIMEAIDEYVWYDIPADLKIEPAKAKSNEVTFSLVQVLVDKGLITYEDVLKTLRK